MRSQTSDEINSQNEEFWSELCGTSLAKHLGITDHSIESINRFDEAFYSFYPYFLGLISPQRMNRKKVLEVGLGYGSLGRKLVEHGAEYLGVDIARNPAKMLKQSFNLLEMPGDTIQVNFLENNFESNEFDFVISIGCFHHTGDIPKCVNESYRILKPGGVAIVMLYNQFSFRQWTHWPYLTFKALFLEEGNSSEDQRKNYDIRSDGSVAPMTEFTSVKNARELFNKFSHVRVKKENFDNIIIRKKVLIPREKLLTTLAPSMGLDLYIEAHK